MIRLLLISLVIFLFGCTGLLRAEQSGASDDRKSASDTVGVYPQKMSNRSTAEEIAHLPGRILYFPFKMVFIGTGELVGFVDDTKIIQQVNDRLESDDGRRKLNFTYASRTGGGVKYAQNGMFIRDLRRNNGAVTVTLGLDQEQLYQLDFKNVSIADEFLEMNSFLRYQKLTSESFFGIGWDSDESDACTYTLEQTTAEFCFTRSITRIMGLKLHSGYEATHIGNGRDNDLLGILDYYSGLILPGLEENIELLYIGGEFNYDTKNKPGNPTGGSEVSVNAGFYSQTGDDRFGFQKYRAGISRYLHLFHNRVMVVKMNAQITEPLNDRIVPFYYLSEHGGEETNRGFARGRFRDNDMLSLSLEYRYPIWRNWHEMGVDMFLFVDTGQTADNMLEDIEKDHFKTGYGFGFRLWDWQDGLVGRMSVGLSEDGAKIYLGLN